MNRLPRLVSVDDIAAGVRRPAYRPEDHAAGIVHLGIGAFHRAHQAVYTDDALAASGGDWRIIGVSLRGTAAADALNPQNGLYTLIERGEGEASGRIIASLDRVIAATRKPGAALAAMTDPAIRIVSLTVTEKAYGIDRAAGGLDESHSAVAYDLGDPRAPSGVLGLLVEALRLRREAGTPPFTVLCCDNLPDNGALLRLGVVDFASRVDPGLAAWIETSVAFPATMVDRITPAVTPAALADTARMTGRDDQAAIETEVFTQWVIEDHFPQGRPNWEAGGAIFVADVAPYERMKLRMLNGTHSMLAYAGFLAGHTLVRDAMADPALSALVTRHLKAAAATLAPLPGIDLTAYAASLAARFRNPSIAHETYQIAMDGTEKLPQRLLQPALVAMEQRQDIRPFAFAVACWMRYCLGRTDDGVAYALRDPREQHIQAALARVDTRDPAAIAGTLHALPGVFPAP
ncbi:mannitol dehydrogenase family protein [Breoghania sp. L-A4]|uniref:mannitol dehydrogenase family protein n=1 Tax=Breoghania sp. L-A4 TaxID=2304600 RepID=UPI000E35D301|nr:mannitol dehydrogenase family protein [Breoghania sp. L-A4]AXS39714.1 mannitol dehydrogenase family protein [Breoghania sp. L-A4]